MSFRHKGAAPQILFFYQLKIRHTISDDLTNLS